MGSRVRTGAIGIRLFWRALPRDIEDVVATTDAIWRAGRFDSIYIYDEDDFAIQNLKMFCALSTYGLDQNQVELVTRGPVTEIETSHNPGFWTNREGLQVSVQWLNYWSREAQNLMFGGRPHEFPSGSEVTDLGDGALRLRLSMKPGRFDDEAFHLLQLECRRCLGLT
jgi:hypothetical protein